MTTLAKKNYHKAFKKLLNEQEEIVIDKVHNFLKDKIKISKGGKSLEDLFTDFKENNVKEEILIMDDKKRGKKSGDKTKRKASAYNRFIGQEIIELKGKGSQGKENMKIATQKWKALSEKEKNDYKKKHEELLKKEAKVEA